MRDLLSDLRQAVRSCVAHPGFTAAVALTLALGIGLTTTVFGIVDDVVLRPLPFSGSDRLMTLCEQHPGATPDWCSVAPPNAEDIAARSRSIEAIGIARTWPAHLATRDGNEGINTGIATPGFFRALGVVPQLGRLIEAGDITGRPGTVAVLTDETWRTRFGGASDVVGRRISLDGDVVTIVGVLPPHLRVPLLSPPALWRPLHIDPRDETNRTWPGFVAFARLRNGVALSAARAELSAIVAEIGRRHFAADPSWGITLRPVQDLVVGGARPILLLFLGAVAVVLLIACANVANLLLARATNRSREIALRAALGAGRWRLIRGLLVESLVLASLGAALGLLFAFWAVDLFKRVAPPGVPRVSEIALDWRGAAIAVLLAFVTALLFGLLPAVRAARADLALALRESGRGASRRSGRTSSVLVVAQLALAVTLVAAAALMTRSFAAWRMWQPGFDRSHLLTFTLFAPNGGMPWERIEEEIRSIPGVVSLGEASAGPLFGGGDGETTFRLVGAPTPERAAAAWYDVSPGFFGALGVPVLRGRDVASTDVRGGPPVALVNEAFARRFQPGRNPVGERMRVAAAESLTMTIVGVVQDVAPARPGETVAPQIYWSNRQFPRGFSYVAVRTAVPAVSIVPALRARLKSVHPDLSPGELTTMDGLLATALEKPRFDMVLFLVFAGAALLLASVGTYGLLAYVVSTRTREIGIRMALGAGSDRVTWTVLREAISLAVPGLLVGTAAAIGAGRLMASIAPGVAMWDPLTLGATVAVLAGVVGGAAAVPARRASRVDPVTALAAE